MRITLVLALSLFLAACGGKSTPKTEPEPTPDQTDPDQTDEPATVTPEACESSGGTVAWDIGDGSVQCPAGTFESSKVSGGVEPGLCCQPTPADAE